MLLHARVEIDSSHRRLGMMTGRDHALNTCVGAQKSKRQVGGWPRTKLCRSAKGIQNDNISVSSDHEPDLIIHLSNGKDVSRRKARQDADRSVEREFVKGNHLIIVGLCSRCTQYQPSTQYQHCTSQSVLSRDVQSSKHCHLTVTVS